MPSNEITEKLSAYHARIDNHRLSVEKSIIGAVLLEEHSLSLVIDVLSPKNFSTTAHQHIWRGITKMYQKHPIDIRTVTHHLVKNGHSLAHEVVTCTTHVNSAANLHHHALHLLELDIFTKFKDLYIQHSADSKVQSFGEDIITSLMNDNDYLKLIEDAAVWFDNVLPNHPFTIDLRDFVTSISLKTQQLKNRTHTRQIVRNFENLQPISAHLMPFVNEIKDLLQIAIIKRKVPDTLLAELQEIKSKVLAHQ